MKYCKRAKTCHVCSLLVAWNTNEALIEKELVSDGNKTIPLSWLQGAVMQCYTLLGLTAEHSCSRQALTAPLPAPLQLSHSSNV